jgi:hypothetical protein
VKSISKKKGKRCPGQEENGEVKKQTPQRATTSIRRLQETENATIPKSLNVFSPRDFIQGH